MTPAETLKAVRAALAMIARHTGNVEVPAVVSAETMMGLWEVATEALAALDRLEVVEGVAFLDGDFFCTEGEGGKCQEAWLMVPGCEHEPDYKADGGELPALLLTVKAET